MELFKRLQNDLKEALKEKDSFKMNTIRLILAALQNEQISKGKENELTDEDVQAVLRKEAKKRKESVDVYKSAQRDELAKQEQEELDLIKTYLPEEMSDEQLEGIVSEAVASGEQNFGKLMGAVMQQTKGRADSSRVKEAIEKALN